MSQAERVAAKSHGVADASQGFAIFPLYPQYIRQFGFRKGEHSAVLHLS